MIVGDIAVGKTSILSRFVDNKFNRDQRSSIGVAYSTKSITLDSKDIVKLDIWDTAGQERFRSISSLFYRESGAALIVYDITDSNSLNTVKRFWLKQIKQYAPNSIIALVGNKLDLTSRRQLKKEDVEKFAEESGLIHLEVSAKTGENVTKIFHEIASRVPDIVENTTSEFVGFKQINTNIPSESLKVKDKPGCSC